MDDSEWFYNYLAEQYAKAGPPTSRETNLEQSLVELLREREARSNEWREYVVGGKIIDPLTRKPKPASTLPDAFPPGASNRKLDNFGHRTGIELPLSLRRWLQITNGAMGFYGVRTRRKDDDIERELDFWTHMKEDGWLPVAYADGGNRYVQLLSNPQKSIEPVCHVEIIGGYISHVVASDMLHFAQLQLEAELYPGFHVVNAERRFNIRRIDSPWPFSKRYMLARDPNMRHITGLPMPWKKERRG